eukprot:481446-Pleurochrysis_carterae.AAC.2
MIKAGIRFGSRMDASWLGASSCMIASVHLLALRLREPRIFLAIMSYAVVALVIESPCAF